MGSLQAMTSSHKNLALHLSPHAIPPPLPEMPLAHQMTSIHEMLHSMKWPHWMACIHLVRSLYSLLETFDLQFQKIFHPLSLSNLTLIKFIHEIA
jgi:hypothetical protein